MASSPSKNLREAPLGATPSQRQKWSTNSPDDATNLHPNPPLPLRGRIGFSEAHILQAQQGRVAARAGGVGAGHPLGAEARQIMGPAGLGAVAGLALASERLRADDRADHRAVDVEIADRADLFDRLGGAGDAGAQAHGAAEGP